MGTEILRPQDCLFENNIRSSPFRRKNNFYNYYPNSYHYNSNPNPRFNRKPAVRSEKTDDARKKQQPQQPLISRRSNSVDSLKVYRNHGSVRASVSPKNNNNNNNFVADKVTILRRGESLDSKIKSSVCENSEMVVTSTERLGPDPEMVPKQIGIVDFKSPVIGRCDMYAGSGFQVSPAPSSLPLPSFSKKKQIDDSATRDLRRLLRLDF